MANLMFNDLDGFYDEEDDSSDEEEIVLENGKYCILLYVYVVWFYAFYLV